MSKRSKNEKERERLTAWESLLQSIGISCSWEKESLKLYEHPDLSITSDKQETSQIPIRLTSREKQVFRYVSDGKSSSEIATILGVSCRTVEKHVQNIYSKMGVHDRSEMLFGKR